MREKLYRLCNQKGYFTCGSSEQYAKMFKMAEQGATAHDIALVIWICSNNKELETIENEVSEICRTQAANSLPSNVIE